MYTRGSKKLKITSILMIIGAVLNIILLTNLEESDSMRGINISISLVVLLTVYSIVAVASVGVQLIAGILGVVNWTKPSKVNLCITLGYVFIGINVLVVISNLVFGFNSQFIGELIKLIPASIIPLIYISGAKQNKQVLIGKYADTIQKNSETEVS